MTINSRGYAAPAVSEREEAFSSFIENLDIIRSNESKILNTAEYFYSELPFAWCSWTYVTGDGPLPLGYLLLGWRDGIFVEPCPDCHSDCLTFTFAGSPLSGSNSWSGYCVECKATKSTRETVHKPFLRKLTFTHQLRSEFHRRVEVWEEYPGTNFSFGGDGLAPALCKRLKAIDLFEPTSLSQMTLELKEGFARPTNSPQTSLHAPHLQLKLSPS